MDQSKGFDSLTLHSLKLFPVETFMKLKIEFKHKLTVVASGTIEVHLDSEYYMGDSAKQEAEAAIESALLIAERSVNSVGGMLLTMRITK